MCSCALLERSGVLLSRSAASSRVVVTSSCFGFWERFLSFVSKLPIIIRLEVYNWKARIAVWRSLFCMSHLCCVPAYIRHLVVHPELVLVCQFVFALLFILIVLAVNYSITHLVTPSNSSSSVQVHHCHPHSQERALTQIVLCLIQTPFIQVNSSRPHCNCWFFYCNISVNYKPLTNWVSLDLTDSVLICKKQTWYL